MPYDPTLPQTNSPIASAQLRAQFQGLQDNIQGVQNNVDAVREKLIVLEPLGQTVSNPPTQAQMQAIANKLDEVINALISV